MVLGGAVMLSDIRVVRDPDCISHDHSSCR